MTEIDIKEMIDDYQKHDDRLDLMENGLDEYRDQNKEDDRDEQLLDFS